MIEVAALTSGRDVPSSRFRVRQHIPLLREQGIAVSEFIPHIEKYAEAPWPCRWSKGSPAHKVATGLWAAAKLAARVKGLAGSRRADITWLEREMISGFCTLEPFLKRPMVFDVDDAIWLIQPFGAFAARRIAARADLLIAGNAHIANWFHPYARAIRIIPTAVDTERIRPRRKQFSKDTQGHFTVGWTGTSSNFPFLYGIEPALSRFLEERDGEILVIADRPPLFSGIPPRRLRFLPWSRSHEIDGLLHMDVGLMPLAPSPWALGKCGFKMLQYMAAGIPVVVSPVGVNPEILRMGPLGFEASSQEDWYGALCALCDDEGLRQELGTKGREIAETRFSRRVVSKAIARALRAVG